MSERYTYIPVEALGLTEEAEAEREVIASREWAHEHFTPSFVGTKAQECDVSELVKQIKLGEENYERGRISQPEGKVIFSTDLPVSIFFVGDIHFGNVYTDHDSFFDDLKRIQETPNAYIVFMANLIDNAIPSQFPDNMLVNAIPPDKQVIAMRKIIQDLNEKGKVLGAVTAPCHEGWTFKKTGQDVNALIFGFPERKFPVLENGGLLYLQFPKAEYLMALYHQVGPYESNFNETHALRQLNRLNLRMRADVVAGGHKHVASVQLAYEGVGRERRPHAYIRTGTYKGIGKINDQYSIGKYGTTGEPSAQSVILWPNKKQIEVFLDLETGILAHESHYIREMIKRKKS